jgi:L-amino acid N-acyltransferase YncA
MRVSHGSADGVHSSTRTLPVSATVIRQATLADLDRILRIWESGRSNAGVATAGETAGRQTPDRVAIEAFFRGRILGQTPIFQIWVAEADREVIAWQSLSAWANNPVTRPLFAESSTYVDAAYHSKGIGRSLLLHAMRHGRKVGIRVIVGFVSPTNRRSIALLKSIGWTQHLSFPFAACQVVPDMLLFTFEPFEREIPE